MKSGIHPAYQETTIVCACGTTFKTRSTVPRVRLEICSSCHPFFTGKHKLLDAAGRVERFQKRYGATGTRPVQRKNPPKAAPTRKTAPRPVVLSTAPKRAKRGPLDRPPRPSAPAPTGQPVPETR